MPSNYPSRRRLNIDLSEEQYRIITSKIPPGSRQSFFEPIIIDICELLLEHPEKFIAAVISRRIKLWEFSQSVRSTKEDDDGSA